MKPSKFGRWVSGPQKAFSVSNAIPSGGLKWQYSQSRLNVFGALGSPGRWGLYGGGASGLGAVVLCSSESGNAKLGPNQYEIEMRK